jgi:transcriptional regulator with XRE-family HTH domain
MEKLPLRAWIAIRKITLKELAEIVEVDRRTVSNWSNKNKVPLAKHQKRIAKALDIEVEQIDFEN